MKEIKMFKNTQARGLENFKAETPIFEERKKASLEELQKKKELSTMATRGAGSGTYEKRSRSAAVDEGTQVDFIVVDGIAHYVGDIKKDNSFLHPIEDEPMVNISTGIVMSIDKDRDVVVATIDRLILGNEDYRNVVNFDNNVKKIATDGKKYQVNNQKSLSLMVTIPESNINDKIKEIINIIYTKFQSLHDYSLTATEKSAIGKGPSFKKQTMFLASKDILRGLIKSANPNASDDDIKKTVGQVFAANGVGPLSTMNLQLTFTVTKVIRTKDPNSYPEYSEIDERNAALRQFVTSFNVSVPMDPNIMVSISHKIEEFKSSLISYINAIHNIALDENAGVDLIPFPNLTIDEHVLAGITEEEFSRFQTEVLPKEAIKGIEALRVLKDTELRARYLDTVRSDSNDDFDA